MCAWIKWALGAYDRLRAFTGLPAVDARILSVDEFKTWMIRRCQLVYVSFGGIVVD